MPITPEAFQPGDVLLYRPRGLFGWLIAVKTWSRWAHVEVYDGGGYSLASRDGIGVGRYPLRLDGLGEVYRLRVGCNWFAARAWFESVKGQPYDWWGLLAFASAKWQGRDNGKMFCSEFAARLLRWAIGNGATAEALALDGRDPWNGYDADGLAPGELCKSALLKLEMRA